MKAPAMPSLLVRLFKADKSRSRHAGHYWDYLVVLLPRYLCTRNARKNKSDEGKGMGQRDGRKDLRVTPDKASCRLESGAGYPRVVL